MKLFKQAVSNDEDTAVFYTDQSLYCKHVDSSGKEDYRVNNDRKCRIALAEGVASLQINDRYAFTVIKGRLFQWPEVIEALKEALS